MLWLKPILFLLKPILVILVVLGIAQSVRVAWNDLASTHAKAELHIDKLHQEFDSADANRRQQIEREISSIENSQFSPSRIRWAWIVASLPIASIAILPAAIFWWLTLARFGHHLPAMATQSAYSVGSLGKYVPGKAMVLILRAGALRKYDVPISTTIVTIFVETLNSLAIAGALGAATVSFLDPPPWLFWIAIWTSIVTLVPTFPPLFQVVIRMITKLKHIRLSIPLTNALTWSGMVTGWVLYLFGWLAMGTAVWMISESVRLPVDPTGDLSNVATTVDRESIQAPPVTSAHLWIASVAACCLSFVAGFLSMLPGGAGVRELVVTILLAPSLGYAPALAVALLYRLVSLVGELAVAGITTLFAKSNQRPQRDVSDGTVKS